MSVIGVIRGWRPEVCKLAAIKKGTVIFSLAGRQGRKSGNIYLFRVVIITNSTSIYWCFPSCCCSKRFGNFIFTNGCIGWAIVIVSVINQILNQIYPFSVTWYMPANRTQFAGIDSIPVIKRSVGKRFIIVIPAITWCIKCTPCCIVYSPCSLKSFIFLLFWKTP